MKDQNYFILTIPTGSNFSRKIVFSYLYFSICGFLVVTCDWKDSYSRKSCHVVMYLTPLLVHLIWPSGETKLRGYLGNELLTVWVSVCSILVFDETTSPLQCSFDAFISSSRQGLKIDRTRLHG